MALNVENKIVLFVICIRSLILGIMKNINLIALIV